LRLIYLIIIGRHWDFLKLIPWEYVRVCTGVLPPGVAVVSGMRWRAFGRCDTLQRVADGIIAACVGLVSAAAERYKLQEKRL
jgi:hypothetical protein